MILVQSELLEELLDELLEELDEEICDESSSARFPAGMVCKITLPGPFIVVKANPS